MKRQLISMLILTALSATTFGQTQKQSARFLKFDTDGDGKLNLVEYTAMVKLEFEKNDKVGYEEEAAKRFKNRDTNGDGFLTQEEFFAKSKK